MNPFDLRGPEFLVFYAVFAALTVLAARHWIRTAEPVSSEPVNLTDPYLIAYLRSGAAEAVNVAVISLIDRGFVHSSGDNLSMARDRSAAGVNHPLEKAIIGLLREPIKLNAVLPGLKLSLDGYQAKLLKDGLIASPGLKAMRRYVWLLATLILLAVAGVKIGVAVSRGRTNIEFLVMLAGVAIFALSKISFPKHTSRGQQALDQCRHLFGGLRSSGKSWQPGSATADLVMLAAVFGAAAVPVAAFPHRNQLFAPYPNFPSSSSSGDGGGSSCGSSSGGGGSGCGGCGGSD
jgi:uncharacterized protein (TIGR04222 family)